MRRGAVPEKMVTRPRNQERALDALVAIGAKQVEAHKQQEAQGARARSHGRSARVEEVKGVDTCARPAEFSRGHARARNLRPAAHTSSLSRPAARRAGTASPTAAPSCSSATSGSSRSR